jgi:hypothetical protein
VNTAHANAAAIAIGAVQGVDDFETDQAGTQPVDAQQLAESARCQCASCAQGVLTGLRAAAAGCGLYMRMLLFIDPADSSLLPLTY